MSDTANESDTRSAHRPTKRRRSDAAASQDTQTGSSDELEIDVGAPRPPSRKQLRKLIKKGKASADGTLTPEAEAELRRKELRRLVKDGLIPKPRESRTDEAKPDDTDAAAPAPASAPRVYGVWVGNLTFATSAETLQRFFTLTAPSEGGTSISKTDIVRVHMPHSKPGVSKGFAYVDFASESAQQAAIALSERNLDGRNLLIKASTDFAGRPLQSAVRRETARPESRVLWVGNLPFDTTSESMQEHFESAGEIQRVRLMTFQDTGKCKGFGFVDFVSVDGARAAMKDRRRYGRMSGRTLTVEYGQDRSQLRKGHKRPAPTERPDEVEEAAEEPMAAAEPRRRKRDPRSIPSGSVLARVKKQPKNIVPSEGEKITFE